MGVGADNCDTITLSGKIRDTEQHGQVRMPAADNDEMSGHLPYPRFSSYGQSNTLTMFLRQANAIKYR